MDTLEHLENQEIQEDDQVPLQKEKKVREKKPRSDKQMAHFANMAAKRKENIEKKKLERRLNQQNYSSRMIYKLLPRKKQ